MCLSWRRSLSGLNRLKRGSNSKSGVRMAARSVVRLGYVRTTYPVLNDCALHSNWMRACKLPGIAMENWKVLAEKLNFDIELVQVPDYGSFVDGNWTGLIGSLVNGSIDASVGYISFTPERYRAIKYSVPLSKWENGFVMQEPVGIDFHLRLQGYGGNVFVFIAAFFVVMCLLEWHRVRAADKAVWSALSAICFQVSSSSRVLRNPLIMFGWLGVVMGYFAGFRSQTITSGFVHPPFETLAEAQRKFGTGTLSLMISHPTVTTDSVYPDVQSSLAYPPLVVGSLEEIAQLLCNTRNLVYFGDTGVLGSIWHVNSPCRLKRVPVTDRVIEMDDNYLAIGFRKKFPLFESANGILMRLFSIEQIEDYWANKYLREFPQHGFANGHYFLPIILTALLPAFYLLFVSLCIALFLCLCERIVSSYSMKKEVINTMLMIPDCDVSQSHDTI